MDAGSGLLVTEEEWMEGRVNSVKLLLGGPVPSGYSHTGGMFGAVSNARVMCGVSPGAIVNWMSSSPVSPHSHA